MLYSHAWLEAFVPHGRTTEEIRDLISRHVATVDDVRQRRQDLRAIVVARVVHAVRHPNSERLWLTKVDDGRGEPLDVVCGASNVTVGTLYPFARTGTTLPGGTTIEKRKIRGETSNGMLCSPDELGLGSDHDGIMALDVDVPPGTPFLDAVPVGDVQYDVDVLPNRPDLLSHIGMARELSALTGVPLVELRDLVSRESGSEPVNIPDPVHGDSGATTGGVPVSVTDADGCTRYRGVVIRGVKVGPSPQWLVQRLASIGARPISNVVDVTNYALQAFGQPMHAFDVGRLAGPEILVRRAVAGERLMTLDGVERSLDPEMTVIADRERAVAVAGVMGGRDSEVSASTTDIFLEVACFSPSRVRAARRRLGLNTDASYRFERGIDARGSVAALTAAAQLLVAVAGGTIAGAPADVGVVVGPARPVQLRASRLSRLSGDEVAPGEIARLLTSIGFDCRVDGDEITATAPSWRHDITRDVDLVEEIARLRGYDVLPDTLSAFRPGSVPDHPLHLLSQRLRQLLAARGLFEVRPLPFVRGDDATHERVRNPLAEDEPHLRRILLESLAHRAEYNLSRMQGHIRIFEIGSVFAPRVGRLPLEELRVGVLLMGARRPPHFTEPHPPSFDAWDAKALAEELASMVSPGSEPVVLEPGDGAPVLWAVRSGAVDLGRVERVALDRPAWAGEAFGVELVLGSLDNSDVAPPGQHAYSHGWPGAGPPPHLVVKPIPTTPAAEFDLALLVPDHLTAADCERVLRQSGGELLERLAVFDEFRGPGIPDGHRSIGWALTFRDPTRTLRDKEVEGRRTKILQTLERELGVRPRSA
jgi:phenylalanyl-tRNA synthetase beta chain